MGHAVAVRGDVGKKGYITDFPFFVLNNSRQVFHHFLLEFPKVSIPADADGPFGAEGNALGTADTQSLINDSLLIFLQRDSIRGTEFETTATPITLIFNNKRVDRGVHEQFSGAGGSTHGRILNSPPNTGGQMEFKMG